MVIRFAGYAALFDVRDTRRDLIERDAFTRTLREQKRIPLYWQHNPDRSIGWVEVAAEDEIGLRVVAASNHEVNVGMGLSFGYRCREFIRDSEGRTIRDVDLFEVSVVSHPMQPDARIREIL